MQQALKALNIKLAEDLNQKELLARLHYATQGVVANVQNLLRRAAVHAKLRGEACIHLVDLAAAFDKRLAKHLPGRENPFRTPTDEPFAPARAPKSTRSSRRQRTAAEVLTTK